MVCLVDFVQIFSPAGYATSKDHVYTLHGDGATAAWPGSKESRTTKELPAAALQVWLQTLQGHVTLLLQTQICADCRNAQCLRTTFELPANKVPLQKAS